MSLLATSSPSFTHSLTCFTTHHPNIQAETENIDPLLFQRALQGFFKVNGTTGIQVSTFSAMPDPFFSDLSDHVKGGEKVRNAIAS